VCVCVFFFFLFFFFFFFSVICNFFIKGFAIVLLLPIATQTFCLFQAATLNDKKKKLSKEER
jgi:hypothetical protein